jgi:hypothetical protein
LSGPFGPHTQNSLSLVHNNNLTYGGGIGPLMRTQVTREDFNIEDLHNQVVLKL